MHELLVNRIPGVFERLTEVNENETRASRPILPVAVDQKNNRADWPLTVPEVAERLRVGRRWVYEHAEQLGVYRAGKYLRFDWSRVTERLRSGTVSAGKLGSQPNDLSERP